MSYLVLLLFAGLAFGLVAVGLLISRLLAPRTPGEVKGRAYECGETTIGGSRLQFNAGFYLIGLLFLVFDVEAAFLFPWALVIRELGIAGLIEVVLFVALLLVALVYAWKRGVMQWV
ncbi:MAG: NADH-quinone oxidoreductase subunit A [Candidatus Cloacimonetes bacterium]|nr:NADH-quinone oxidoreductase subunit A [Candidatus Cloacimonadota bacterium]